MSSVSTSNANGTLFGGRLTANADYFYNVEEHQRIAAPHQAAHLRAQAAVAVPVGRGVGTGTRSSRMGSPTS